MMGFQATLQRSVTFSGIGLHSGCEAKVTLHPSPAETGILFTRSDLSPPLTVPATIENVVQTDLSTTLAKGRHVIASVEHLMAAFYATGIDNVSVSVDGPEIPIMDGSSLPFVTGILEAGIAQLPQPRKYLSVRGAVTARDGEKSITVIPDASFRISFEMRFRHPLVGSRRRHYDPRIEDFVHEYTPARTFGFLSDAASLEGRGKARGASLANAVVIGEDRILNSDGLRFPDEFIRHKILDLAGDLYLSGYHIMGHIHAFKSGHKLNHKLVRLLLGGKECRFFEPAKEADLKEGDILRSNRCRRFLFAD